MSQAPHARHVELDLLRSAAIVLMVAYHLVYDLGVLYALPVSPLEGGWRLLARATAVLFLLVSGMSSVLAYERRRVQAGTLWRGTWRRFLRIGAAALLVTAATYAAAPDQYVRFGILHLAAVASLLLPLTRGLREWSVVPGAACVALGLALRGITVPTSLLLPLGLPPPAFVSMDYFPLLPWFGVLLIGQALGALLYGRIGLRVPVPNTPSWRALAWPGRHPLPVYLLHQPLILAVLFLLLGPPAA